MTTVEGPSAGVRLGGGRCSGRSQSAGRHAAEMDWSSFQSFDEQLAQMDAQPPLSSLDTMPDLMDPQPTSSAAGDLLSSRVDLYLDGLEYDPARVASLAHGGDLLSCAHPPVPPRGAARAARAPPCLLVSEWNEREGERGRVCVCMPMKGGRGLEVAVDGYVGQEPS